jgi:predicted ATPase/DNA-binding SARP family transcriptional activator
MFQLALLGPFLATASTGVLTVRGEIPRAAIARLALSAGDTVSADELITALWADPPPTVLSSLRAHLSRLRAQGWADLISGGRFGYTLKVDPAAIDLLEYRRLVAADAQPRDTSLEAAERLWRGIPLAGLAAFPFAGPIVDQMTELRRFATLELARLRLDRGEHAPATLALHELLTAQPHDQEIVELAARALARAGRTGDALDLLDDFRARLMADRGLDPDSRVTDLRQSIVRRDPVVLGSAHDAVAPVERFGVPLPLTRFIGRSRELAAVDEARTESRLVTLLGPAGVGKTRLAIEAARRTTSAVDDQQWLVDLAVFTDPSRVLPAVADAVGASERALDPIVTLLSGRRTLLILDNAEHVLGAVASLVSDLLARCEGLTVLVTSREALRMAGERLVPVEPLVGEAAGDAVRLFVQRAADAGAPTWSDHQLELAGRLCASLDGLPLALELAAARLDVLTLEEVVDSLRTDGSGGSGRHGSLDAAIAWSVALLSPPELAALRQVALFAGSFALDAVARVCAVQGADARELAVALARKSLVTPVQSETGVRRFRMLESVREHMLARHQEPDPASWQERHTAWAVELVAATFPVLRSSDARRGVALLVESRADLDAALERAIVAVDRATALAIAGPQAWHWYERAQHADGRVALERVLALPGERVPVAEGAAYRALAFMAAVGRDPRATGHAVERMRRAALTSPDPELRMISASMAAYVAITMDSDSATADRLLDEATALRDDPGNGIEEWARGDDLVLRADTLRALGRPSQALDVAAQTFRVGMATGNVFATKGSCYVTGKTLVDVRRAREALPVLRTGIVTSLESEDMPSMLSMTAVLAAALVHLERHREAARVFGAAEALGRRYGFSPQGADAGYHRQALAAARAALTVDEWTTAYAAGAALSLRDLMQELVVSE